MIRGCALSLDEVLEGHCGFDLSISKDATVPRS